MTLTAHVQVSARGVDARFTAHHGTTVALLGHNGAGKSTVLEVLAGLLTADSGEAAHGSRAMFSGRAPRAPQRRSVGFVAQDTSLFPAMSVLDNVAFGIRARGRSTTDARAAALVWLERVGAADLADRRPRSLSGGQQRRVALARAWAPEPELLLLDEPFAGLDLESATAIRALTRQMLEGVTAVIATHDALDAHALADQVVVLEAGSVVEAGPTQQVMSQPRTAFAARMAGRVLLQGITGHGVLDLGGGETIAVANSVPGMLAAVAIHPRDLVLAPDGLTDTVRALEPHGDLVRVHGTRLMADVEPSRAIALHPGQRVAFALARGARIPSAYAV